MIKKLLISLLLCTNLFANEADNQIQNLTIKAYSGDIDAQNSLGIMYHNGDGIEKNKKNAFYWYQMAAKNGNSNSQYMVGIYYAFGGGGIKRDTYKSKYWLKKASNNGNSEATKILNNSNFFTLLEKDFSDKLYDETVISYIKSYKKKAKDIKVTYKEKNKRFNEAVAYFTYLDNKSKKSLYGKITLKKDKMNFWYATHFKSSTNKNDL